MVGAVSGDFSHLRQCLAEFADVVFQLVRMECGLGLIGTQDGVEYAQILAEVLVAGLVLKEALAFLNHVLDPRDASLGRRFKVWHLPVNPFYFLSGFKLDRHIASISPPRVQILDGLSESLYNRFTD